MQSLKSIFPFLNLTYDYIYVNLLYWFSFYEKVLCYLCQITLEDFSDTLVPAKLQTVL